MQRLLNSLFKVESGEWPKLLQFGLFGLMLQTGLGIGFSAGDAAFLSHVGPGKLPVIFLLTPVVMLVYTGIFSYLLVRFSIDRVVDVTLGMLVVGGAALWWLLSAHLAPGVETILYYVLKLYLAMWYIALYSLFWNFTDAYFNIQDAKRLFPLFAACCALGTACGAVIVSLFAGMIPMPGFLLIWAGVALATVPVAWQLRRRWKRIADSDTELDGEAGDVRSQIAAVAKAFRGSRYALMLALALFVTLLITNLAEFQYSSVLQKGRSEADLAELFGRLYAASNVFNLLVCLFAFNRLVTRIGVRNTALIMPATYFVAFGYFFLTGGEGAALAAFFAYHGVLTSIDYNNQNLLFNALPSAAKRPMRTVIEGLAEPLASFLAGGFLLFAATHADTRQLSVTGMILGAVLVAVVVALRNDYPQAMGANMRRGWLNFGDLDLRAPQFDDEAKALLEEKAADPETSAVALGLVAGAPPSTSARDLIEAEPSPATDFFAARLASPSPTVRNNALQSLVSLVGPGDIGLVTPLIASLPRMDRAGRETIIALLGQIGDVEAIPQILAAAARLSPRERRAIEVMLVGLGETAIPRLVQVLGSYSASYRARSLAGRALVALSQAQFMSLLDRLIHEELSSTRSLLAVAERFAAEPARSVAISQMAVAYSERIAISVDFVLELLALGGLLPDFDLLIVSMHSSNPKVRANAIEAIASGAGPGAWRLLEPLINQRRVKQGPTANAEAIVPLLQHAIATGHPFEVACAAQALRDYVPEVELTRSLRAGMKPGLPPLVRDTFATLLSLDRDPRPTIIDIADALRRIPDFAGASTNVLLALAERIAPEPEGPSMELKVGERSFWLARSHVDTVAMRSPEFALVLLRAQDGRPLAA